MQLNSELLRTIQTEQAVALESRRANSENIQRNSKGSFSNGLASTLRMLGMLDFLLDKDIKSFRQRLAESASTYLKLFERFDAGEPISPSYVSMLAYKQLFDALASGDMLLSATFAKKMGGRNEIEKEHDTAFTITIGYTLKHLVLNEDEIAKSYLDELLSICSEKEINFQGYAAVIAAILNNNETAMNNAIPALIEGHKRESRGQGMFSDLLDEHLAVWAIGLGNLAKERGLFCNADTGLIPKDLVR